MDERLREIFLDKPELVSVLPEWMLPESELRRLRARHNLAIVELAGRDSVAAGIKAAQEGAAGELLPVLVYTGSEYGRFAWAEQAWQRLRAGLPAGVELHPLLVMGSPGFWRAMNGRFLQKLQAIFGFCPVCPGCHLYLHAVRLPLAVRLGGAPIIAGERASHDGKVKINQLPLAQKVYGELAASFGVELLLPLARVAQGAEVERLLGQPWPAGGEQLGCVLSGNYQEADGRVEVSLSTLSDYFRRFALPLARAVVREYLDGREPDHQALAAQALAACLAEPAV